MLRKQRAASPPVASLLCSALVPGRRRRSNNRGPGWRPGCVWSCPIFSEPYRAAVIGRTGRGDYGHSLDLALLDQPKLKVVAVADEDPVGRAAAAKRLRVDRDYADYRAMLDRERPQFVAVAP